MPINGLDEISNTTRQNDESTNLTSEDSYKNVAVADNSDDSKTKPNSVEEIKEVPDGKVHRVQTWTEIRPSLCAIEDLMSSRVKRKVILNKSEELRSFEEARPGKGASEEDSEEEYYDLERSESDPIQDITPGDTPTPPVGPTGHAINSESLPPWKEELACLVQGGVPMALRGEVTNDSAFIGLSLSRILNTFSLTLVI